MCSKEETVAGGVVRLLVEGAAELPLAEVVDQRALVGGDLETDSIAIIGRCGR